jgi:hypothetical protein
MAKRLFDSLDSKVFQVIARFTKSDAAQDHLADREVLSDEMIERYAARYQVTPGLSGVERDVRLTGHSLQSLHLNEGDLAIGAACLAEGSLLSEVAIAGEPAAGNRLRLLNAMQPLAFLFCYVNAFQTSIEHDHLTAIKTARNPSVARGTTPLYPPGTIFTSQGSVSRTGSEKHSREGSPSCISKEQRHANTS